MSVNFFQPIRRLFFWALVITVSLFLQTMAYAAQVTLAWDPNNPAPDGYRVYARIDGQNYDYTSPAWPQAGDDPSLTTCTIDNLAEGTSYFFVVRAYVGSDESIDSNEINHITETTQTTTYTITSNAGVNGTISPTSATVNAGDGQTFNISPNTGYHIDDVLVDGISVGPVTSFTFDQIGADHIISATFSVDDYVISAVAEGGGVISPGSSVTVAHGADQSFTFTPESGYHVVDVLIDGESVGSISSYTFSNVTSNHTIVAVFEILNHTITATAGPSGSITPSGAVSIADGGSRTFSITPDSGFRIQDVVVDGVSVGPVSSYAFSNVTADHYLTATFTSDSYVIGAAAGEGGTIFPSGQVTVASGGSQTFSVAAAEGFEVENLIVDGQSQGALESYSFSQVSSNHTIQALFKACNQSPIADAGPDQTVDEQRLVTLNGTYSNDPDDGIASFQWRQIKGTAVALTASSEEIAHFTAPDVDTTGEALEFELIVTDYSGDQASDRCIVNVTWVNAPPTARTGSDQSVNEGSLVQLSAIGSTDPDDGIVTYYWEQIQGQQVVLSDQWSASPSFTAPDVTENGASLIFQLTVTDEGGLKDTDTCTVSVSWNNEEPIADGGPNQSVHIGDEVMLDGSQSTDPEGMALEYQWRQSYGTPVTLSDATSVRPVFLVPEDFEEGTQLLFELTVTDSGGLKAVDVCEIVVEASEAPEDTTPPTLVIDHPADEFVYSFKGKTYLTGFAEDDGEVVRVEWNNDRGGSGEAEGTTRWQIEGVKLSRGTNTITVTAIDAAGNQQSKVIRIYYTRWWRR